MKSFFDRYLLAKMTLKSKSIEEYEENKLKNEDSYSCFYAFVQLPVDR